MAQCRHYDICGLEALEGTEEGLCILHSTDREKDKNAFGQALAEHREKNGVNFQFFVFPVPADFREVKFTEKVYFSDATFYLRAYFDEATFAKPIDFGGAKFNEEAFFRFAKFSDGAYFANAGFGGKADFFNVPFAEGAEFRNATFADEADFSSAKFIKEVNFSKANFAGIAKFAGTDFTEDANFSRALFTNGADFQGVSFTKGADFSAATFSKQAVFSNSEFTGGANFSPVVFSESVTFHGATFNQRVKFGDATFNGGAEFTRVMFDNGVDFNRAAFKKETHFISVTFSGRADFRYAIFAETALFFPLREATHTRELFAGAEVDFRWVRLEPLDAVIFRDVDLEKCRFEGTDLRKAEITGAKWCPIGGRFGVYDEIVPLSEGERRQWPHIERLYRELKQNFEERRDYERAGDFHYGEKEMRRKSLGTPRGLGWFVNLYGAVRACVGKFWRQKDRKHPRGLWFFLTLYWLVSGYGERYMRPLGWWLFVLLLSTFGYLGFGLAPKLGGPELTWSRWDGLRAGFYSLQVMTLLKPDDLLPLGYAKLVHAGESLLGPLLIGLFALALRQRLKR